MGKAQAALEFLTTYSWALLIIAVMIGAIVYFGVVNPNAFISEKCNAERPLICLGTQMDYVNKDIVLRVKIKTINKDVSSLKIEEFNISIKKPRESVCYLISPTTPINMQFDKENEFIISCQGGDINSEIQFFDGQIKYKEDITNFSYTSEIQVIAKVHEKYIRVEPPPSSGPIGLDPGRGNTRR